MLVQKWKKVAKCIGRNSVKRKLLFFLEVLRPLFNRQSTKEPKCVFVVCSNTIKAITYCCLTHVFVSFQHLSLHRPKYFQHNSSIGKRNSAVFWRKVLLVLKVILRYGHLKFFFFGQEKHPIEWLLESQT